MWYLLCIGVVLIVLVWYLFAATELFSAPFWHSGISMFDCTKDLTLLWNPWNVEQRKWWTKTVQKWDDLQSEKPNCIDHTLGLCSTLNMEAVGQLSPLWLSTVFYILSCSIYLCCLQNDIPSTKMCETSPYMTSSYLQNDHACSANKMMSLTCISETV